MLLRPYSQSVWLRSSQVMQVDQYLVAWITDYLTDRAHVRLQGCLSDVVTSSTGIPQETVLSTFLFTLYTSDFWWTSNAGRDT